MARFIEIENPSGQKKFINIENIDYIETDFETQKCLIVGKNLFMKTLLDYEVIKQKIEEVQK